MNNTPTIHQAFVRIAKEIRKQKPKTSLPEAFEQAKEPFTEKHGIEYNYSERTFLNHFYQDK